MLTESNRNQFYNLGREEIAVMLKIKDWINNYISSQQKALESIDTNLVIKMIEIIKKAHTANKNIFIFGNGGSASNSSHFATDLGKSSSDLMRTKFRVLSLNDNVSWITAIGNDYRQEDIYKRQLENYGNSGDIIFVLSVSGDSPNLVNACNWAKEKGLTIMALVGANKGEVSEIADYKIIINTRHYGRAEDCQMTICHLICYSFLELSYLRD